jgi:hypothetical protein
MSFSDETDDEFDEISDEFGELSPAERHDTMASVLSQFGDTMRDNNKRIFSRVLDMIAETEGDDKLHLDMLATHLETFNPREVEIMSWDMPEVTSLSDYRARSILGDDDGLCDPTTEADGVIARYLSDLETEVRKHASRDLLGDLVEDLQLPAEFVEFMKHTCGVTYPNLDKTMFVCTFATVQYCPWVPAHYCAEEHTKPLDKLCEFAGCRDFEVAAGWQAGSNDMNSWIHYLLCKDYDEPDEPWQWKIFTMNTSTADGDCFNSLGEFLTWYANAYDWVHWKYVQMSVDSLHQRCKEAAAEEEDQE